MKKIELTARELDNFRKIAPKYKMNYNVHVEHGQISVVANTSKLKQLGYL
jgi:hypothetical protein